MQDTNLTKFGFDEWFEERREDLENPDWRIARVTAVDR